MTPLGDPWYLVEKAMTRAISKKSSFKIIADWKETLSKTTQQRGKRKNVTLESFCETARFSTHCSYCVYWDNFSPDTSVVNTRLIFEEVTKTKFNLGIDRATILRAIDRVVR